MSGEFKLLGGDRGRRRRRICGCFVSQSVGWRMRCLVDTETFGLATGLSGGKTWVIKKSDATVFRRNINLWIPVGSFNARGGFEAGAKVKRTVFIHLAQSLKWPGACGHDAKRLHWSGYLRGWNKQSHHMVRSAWRNRRAGKRRGDFVPTKHGSSQRRQEQGGSDGDQASPHLLNKVKERVSGSWKGHPRGCNHNFNEFHASPVYYSATSTTYVLTTTSREPDRRSVKMCDAVYACGGPSSFQKFMRYFSLSPPVGAGNKLQS